MISAIFAALGVPLWLCALGILTMVLQNRKLRKRDGDIPVRVRRPGKTRWTRGHAVWVSEVFAWRGSPAAWNEDLLHVSRATLRTAGTEERKKLRRLGDDPAIAMLVLDDGQNIQSSPRAWCKNSVLVSSVKGSAAQAAMSSLTSLSSSVLGARADRVS